MENESPSSPSLLAIAKLSPPSSAVVAVVAAVAVCPCRRKLKKSKDVGLWGRSTGPGPLQHDSGRTANPLEKKGLDLWGLTLNPNSGWGGRQGLAKPNQVNSLNDPGAVGPMSRRKKKNDGFS